MAFLNYKKLKVLSAPNSHCLPSEMERMPSTLQGENAAFSYVYFCSYLPCSRILNVYSRWLLLQAPFPSSPTAYKRPIDYNLEAGNFCFNLQQGNM